MERRVPKNWKKRRLGVFGTIFVLVFGWGCVLTQEVFSEDVQVSASEQGNKADDSSETIVADVLSVKVTGDPNAYRFSVEVASPDEGRDQYADWWEVLTEDGGLVYQRVLAHSHVDEQSFVRSGGPVAIAAETVVIVRTHMHPGGYGGKALKGTVQNGFEDIELAAEFAAEVETEPPSPQDVRFELTLQAQKRSCILNQICPGFSFEPGH